MKFENTIVQTVNGVTITLKTKLLLSSKKEGMAVVYDYDLSEENYYHLDYVQHIGTPGSDFYGIAIYNYNTEIPLDKVVIDITNLVRKVQ